MKRLCITIIAALGFSALAPASGIDGTWLGTIPPRSGQESGTRARLHLKSEGSKITGTMTAGRGGRKSAAIEDGTIEDGRISFTTTVNTQKKGKVKRHWEGTVTGDEMKLSTAGHKRPAEFVRKRHE